MIIVGMYSSPSRMGGTSTPNQKRVPLWYPRVPPILGGTTFFQNKLSTPHFGGVVTQKALNPYYPQVPPIVGGTPQILREKPKNFSRLRRDDVFLITIVTFCIVSISFSE